MDSSPIARRSGRVHHCAVDTADVALWVAGYLEDFAALGRGEIEDVGRILTHYGVPLILGSDAECVILTDEAQVQAAAQQQFDALQSAGYDRSEVLSAESTVLNKSCAIHHGRYARIRADGSEISRIESTYLITEGPAGRRISAIVRHTPK